MVIRIPTRVKSLEEVEEIVKGEKGKDDKPILTYEKKGWFVLFEGSYEALFVGFEKPEGLEPGTEVDIIIKPK